jgi:hypothetical protein
LAIGIAFNQPDENKIEDISFWNAVKNQVKLIFSFDKLTQFSKTLFSKA